MIQSLININKQYLYKILSKSMHIGTSASRNKIVQRENNVNKIVRKILGLNYDAICIRIYVALSL